MLCTRPCVSCKNQRQWSLKHSNKCWILVSLHSRLIMLPAHWILLIWPKRAFPSLLFRRNERKIHLKCTHCCLRKNKNTLPLVFHNVLKKWAIFLAHNEGIRRKTFRQTCALWNLEDRLIKYNRVSKEKLFKDVLKMSVLRAAGYCYRIPH